VDKPNFIEAIADQTKRNLSMTSVPVSTIKQFKKLCKEECGNVYSVGLQQLLKTKEKWDEIIPLLSAILSELQEIKTQHEKKTERRIPTFG